MRPQVVAHRGASHENAEHTLGAYASALEQGAEALECDVRLTADGHLVCVHDRDLRRIAARRDVVSAMELAELSELDFARWKNPWSDLDDEAPDRDPDRDGVLTCGGCWRRWRRTTGASSWRSRPSTRPVTRGLVERKLVEMLKEFGWHEGGAPVRVMSFSYVALQRMQRLAPELRVVMLVEHARHWPVLRPLVEKDWIVGPGIGTLRRHPAFARRLADSGRELHVWTVNAESDLRLCLDLGVQAVITDRPRFVLDLLDAPTFGG